MDDENLTGNGRVFLLTLVTIYTVTVSQCQCHCVIITLTSYTRAHVVAIAFTLDTSPTANMTCHIVS